MQVESLNGVVSTLVWLIRFIVDRLSVVCSLLSNAGGNFVDGLARTLGMDYSDHQHHCLIVGLMLWSAIQCHECVDHCRDYLVVAGARLLS